jgi:hypothetical protein
MAIVIKLRVGFAESDLLIEMTVTTEVAANVANTMLAVINQK